jgi:hypothetical protein
MTRRKSINVRLNDCYSKGGVIFYDVTLNALDSFLNYKAGKRVVYTAAEISLRYTMG